MTTPKPVATPTVINITSDTNDDPAKDSVKRCSTKIAAGIATVLLIVIAAIVIVIGIRGFQPKLEVTTIVVHAGKATLPVKAAVQQDSETGHRWHVYYSPAELDKTDKRHGCAHRLLTGGFVYTFMSPECSFSPTSPTECFAMPVGEMHFDPSSMPDMIARIERTVGDSHGEIVSSTPGNVPFIAPVDCKFAPGTSSTSGFPTKTEHRNNSATGFHNATASPSGRRLRRGLPDGWREDLPASCRGTDRSLHYGGSVKILDAILDGSKVNIPDGKESLNLWHDALVHSDENVRQNACRDLVNSNAVSRNLRLEREEHSEFGQCHQALAVEWAYVYDLFFLIFGGSWGWYVGAATETKYPDRVVCYAGWIEASWHAELGLGYGSQLTYTAAGYMDLEKIKGRAKVYSAGVDVDASLAGISHSHVHINDEHWNQIGVGVSMGAGWAWAASLGGGTILGTTNTPRLIESVGSPKLGLCADVGGDADLCESGKAISGGVCHDGEGSLDKDCNVGWNNGKYCKPNGRYSGKGQEHGGKCLGQCWKYPSKVGFFGAHKWCCSGHTYWSWEYWAIVCAQ